MSDAAFVRQRRCLNIISLLLIAYFATGMELLQNGLLGVGIRHEIVAYTLIWTAFFYLWWRFYLFGADVQRQWKLDFLFELCKNPKYRALYEQPEGEGQSDQMVWAPSLRGEGFRRYLCWEEAYLVGVRVADDQIQFAEQETFYESVNPATQRWSVGPDTVVPIKWFRYAWPAFKANISAMTNRSGSEWALPNFLACLALICGISALITKIV